MIVFLQWLKGHIATWWAFLCNTDVPGCSFSFATLFLFILCANFVVYITSIVIRRKLGLEDTEK